MYITGGTSVMLNVVPGSFIKQIHIIPKNKLTGEYIMNGQLK